MKVFFQIALPAIFAVGLAPVSPGQTFLPRASKQEFRCLPVTTENRNYPGIMFGGWGPHLRGLMEAPDGSLWFATDFGPDVQHNQEIIYHHFDGKQWREAARVSQLPGIQQNVASVMSGRTIFSYGISVREPRLVEECSFDTADFSHQSRAPIAINGKKLVPQENSNYIGAALDPAGHKLIWWTTVGVNGGEGLLSYVFESQGQWHGPVVTPLNGFNDFGYIFAAFPQKNQVLLAGQLFRGAYPRGDYAVGCAEFQPGEKLHLTALPSHLPSQGRSAADVWTHNGATYLLAETHQGSLACYDKDAVQKWSEVNTPSFVLPGVYRARFVETEDALWLVTGGVNDEGVLVRHIPKSSINGPIPWPAIPAQRLPDQPGFLAPSAIYVESRNYQTAPVQHLNFAIAGKYPGFDHQIWHVQLRPAP